MATASENIPGADNKRGLRSRDGFTGSFETVAKWKDEKEVQQSKTGVFTAAATPEDFSAWVASLSGKETPSFGKETGQLGPLSLGYAYDCFMYGLDLRMKARLRPAVGADSPWITRDNIKINLATGEKTKDGVVQTALSIEKCIGAVNAGFEQSALLGNDVPNAFVVAKRMHLENKTAREREGKLVPIK